MQDEQKRFQLPQLTRAIQAETLSVDAESRTVEFPFSSELAVERWFGDEVLSHKSGAADLTRLNDGAPLLFNHNMDEIIGVVEKAYMGDDKRGYAKIRFAKTARAEEVMSMVDDGILRNVSFGYRISEMVESVKDGKSTYTATRWEPFEVSLVTVPADHTVGIGRSEADDKRDVTVHRIQEESAQPAEITTEEPTMTEQTAPDVDVQVVATQAAEAERARIAAIDALGQRFNASDLSRKLINEGVNIDAARAAFLEEIKVDQKPITGKEADVGLTDKEVRQFSVLRALNALANPADKQAWEAAAFEREVSEASAKAAGKSARGIFVPGEVLRAKRDLNVGTATAGGNVVATDLMASSFIDLLRNQSVVVRSGATVMNGLVGNVAIPRQTGAATAYWVAESGAPTESDQTIGQVTMTPRTVGAFTDFSRRLILQSSIDVENMVRRDLAAVIALAIDTAALYGTAASNQPRGLKNQVGINLRDFAAVNPTFAELVGMETEVATDNADIGAMRYLLNPAQRGNLKTSPKFGSGTEATIWEPGNTVNGYATEVSNQVTAGDVFFGNFADLMIGFWSGLDLTVDPYAGATSGTVRVIALQDTDIAVRNAVSFCYGNASIA
jgi:HK97 family phage major capsid protein/HK97 family phage prohead protease